MQFRKNSVISLLLFLLLLFGNTQSALAHAVPVTSSPRPNEILDTAPQRIVIEFNEPIVPDLSHIRVLSQAGERLETAVVQTVDAENRALMLPLPLLDDGAYLVSWQVLSSVDGHTTSGTFSFGVGEATLTAVGDDVTVTTQYSLLSILARWLTLTGISLLMGLFAFRLLVWNPILAHVELEKEEEALDLAQARLGIRIGMVGLGLLGLALILIFIDQNGDYSLLQLNNFQTWLGTQFGRMWLIRFFLIAVSHFNLSLFMNVKNGRSELRGWEWWAGFVLALGLSLTSALISHSAALSDNTLQAILIDWVHVLAATIWVGGLVFLAVAVWQTRRLSAESRTWFNLSMLLHFSGIAALCVGLLAVSGAYLAATHIGSWTLLVGTAYGLTLLGKLGVAAVVALVAAINLVVIKPRLNRAYDAPDEALAQRLLTRFNRLVRLEAALGALLLLAAGVLTDLQRGADAPLLADAPGVTEVSSDVDGLTVDMTIEPALVGQNSFEILVTDENGQPVPADTEVDVRYTFLSQSIGADTAVAQRQEDGSYLLEGSYISLIGAWQVEVSIRRPGSYDTFAPFRLDAGIGGNIRPLREGGQPLERFASFMTLASKGGTGLAMVLFALGWGFVATRAARTEWQLLPLLAISLLAFWLGTLDLITFFDTEYTPSRFTNNPILPDATSVAIGQSLFNENCISCHGPEGRGNGPAAVSLNPPPADFAAGHTGTHPDGDLYFWIREGVEDTVMPAFGDQFTKDETWHLVNYVRRLSNRTDGAAAATP